MLRQIVTGAVAVDDIWGNMKDDVVKNMGRVLVLE